MERIRKTRNYAGIDYFRVIAAFLVIGIHVAPFSCWNENIDYLITYCFGRIAVPFFFMIAGYFVIAPYIKGGFQKNNKLKKYFAKNGMIYLAATMIYIPVNLYAGNFPVNFWGIIKSVIFDGTFYHLWYFPAMIIGCALIIVLCNRSIKGTIVFSVILYLIGLLGDSYYGIVTYIPILKKIYNVFFNISSYTRNGIFFAPIFLMLGTIISLEKRKYQKNICKIGFLLSLFFMLIEGFLTYSVGWQRHNSMYIFLVPVMYYLFQFLLLIHGDTFLLLRRISGIIYVIHPAIIISLRGIAKYTDTKAILIDNTFVQYIYVSLITIIVAIIICFVQKRIAFKKFNLKKSQKKQRKEDKTNNVTSYLNRDRAWVEVDLKNLKWNVTQIKKLLKKNTKIMAVVKANAYGHGVSIIVPELLKIGICDFAVATLTEAIELRKWKIDGTILILGYTMPEKAYLIEKYQLTQAVMDSVYAQELEFQKKKISVHVAINTGMNRVGINCNERNQIIKIMQSKYINVTGIFSHLCTADSLNSEDIQFTNLQILEFFRLNSWLREKGYKIPIHIQSSYGIINYSRLECDFVRPGIILYGCYSNTKKGNIILKPVLSLKAKVIQIRKVQKGQSVGYGRVYKAEKEKRIGVISIGYADGVPRNVKNAEVLIHEKRFKIVGRICMDQLMVDLEDNLEVKAGDEVTLIGKSGNEEISAEEFAVHCGTITNEILSRMGARLPKIIKH